MRHGKPALAQTAWIAPAAMKQWIIDYNLAKITNGNIPPTTLEIVGSAACIVTSNAPRALSSVYALGHTPSMVDALFGEASLPYAQWRFPRLSPFVWAAFFRMLWFLGYSRDCDSIQATRLRAKTATRKLISLAQHNTVLLVGHGIMNHLIAQELITLGWSGTAKGKNKYWSASIYEILIREN